MITLRSAARSHTGYIRTNNEDLAVVSGDLVAIADGMGGHLGGEVAARTAIDELIDCFRRDRTPAGLVAAVRRANRAVWRRSRTERKLHGMGTTLCALALVPVEGSEDRHLLLVNVGDSRAYRLDHDEAGPRAARLTEDHSVVEEMVRQGDLSPAEAAVHPHRHVLTRALGIDSEVDVDVWDVEPVAGTRLLVCSDGLSDYVPEDEIAGVLEGFHDPEEAAGELIGRGLAHGGIDNVTAVVVDISDGDDGHDDAIRLVPERTAGPDRGDAERSDVTQALPITARAETNRAQEADREEEVAAPGEAGGAPTLAVVREAEPTGPSEAPPGASEDPHTAAVETVAVAAPLFDGELDGDGSAREANRGGAHRRGRTMTVRGTLPPGTSLQDASPSQNRGVVLVPTKKLAKQYRDRVFTLRVFVFLLILTGILGGLAAVVIWFDRSSYFVGLDGNRVSIYQGRPGGILWFKPQLLETSNLTTHQLLPNSDAEVRGGIEESSYKAAQQELTDLVKLSRELGLSAYRVGAAPAVLLASRAGTVRGGDVAKMSSSDTTARIEVYRS